MKRKPRIALFSILAVAVLFLLAQCDLLSPPIPPVVVDVSLTAFNIGAVTGIPGIQFGQYSAHLTDGTSWSSSSSGNSGVFDVELNSGTYNVVVTLNAPSAPVPAMSSLSVYTGNITGGGGAPTVTGNPGAYVVTFSGVSIPSSGGGITINID